MTAKEAFRAGFRDRALARGYGEADLEKLAETAAQKAAFLKSALPVPPWLAAAGGATLAGITGAGDAIKSTLGTAGPLAGAALIGAPIAAGVGGGYALSRLTDIDDKEVERIRKQELIDEYKRNAQRLVRRSALQAA